MYSAAAIACKHSIWQREGKDKRIIKGGEKPYIKAMQLYIRIKGPVRSEWVYLQEVHQ